MVSAQKDSSNTNKIAELFRFVTLEAWGEFPGTFYAVLSSLYICSYHVFFVPESNKRRFRVERTRCGSSKVNKISEAKKLMPITVTF